MRDDSERTEILWILAREIARDNGSEVPCEREWAWAVQQTNEIVLKRNAFRGLDGMTAEHAQTALDDYRADRRRWNVRVFEDELARGVLRCVAMKNHPYPDMPDGIMVHRNSPWLVDSWRRADMVQAEYRVEDCPAPHEHR